MKAELPSPPGFWPTVRLLVAATWQRATGRRTRQRQLLSQRSSGQSTDWSGFGYGMAVLFMAGLNIGAAFVLSMAVDSGERIEAEHKGKIVVSQEFLDEVRAAEKIRETPLTSCVTRSNVLECFQTFAHAPDPGYSSEARRIEERYGLRRRPLNRNFAMRCAISEPGTSSPRIRRLPD